MVHPNAPSGPARTISWAGGVPLRNSVMRWAEARSLSQIFVCGGRALFFGGFQWRGMPLGCSCRGPGVAWDSAMAVQSCRQRGRGGGWDGVCMPRACHPTVCPVPHEAIRGTQTRPLPLLLMKMMRTGTMPLMSHGGIRNPLIIVGHDAQPFIGRATALVTGLLPDNPLSSPFRLHLRTQRSFRQYTTAS